MNVEIRGESVVISGYVNTVERYSKPITSQLREKKQTFIERIKAGVFKTALKRNDNVKVLLNHNMEREIANTNDGSAILEEDNIGLRAEVSTNDKEIVEKARQNKLVGWSFGFYPNADEIGAEGNTVTRTLTDLDLVEVSILDDTKKPAYYGTSIEARCEGGRTMEIREEIIEETQEETQGIDIEQLAEIVANKVVSMLTEQKAEETEEEKTEEETAKTEETETEVETDADAEEETEEEKRAIDYSAFESRIAKL